MIKRGRGRPPYEWAKRGERPKAGGSYVFELKAHRPVIRARVLLVDEDDVVLIHTQDHREFWLDLLRVKRFREVESLFDPNDYAVLPTGEPVIVDGYEDGQVRVRRFKQPDLLVPEREVVLYR